MSNASKDFSHYPFEKSNEIALISTTLDLPNNYSPSQVKFEKKGPVSSFESLKERSVTLKKVVENLFFSGNPKEN